jgi:class 3 adenylate cyclase/tetratricopeptide (TPR) repeat protein
MSMHCPRCQVDNRDGAQFCRECGARLAGPCPVCGAVPDTGSKYCDRCGAALAGPPPAEATQPPESYTPKHLAEKILTSRSALEGERKHVTVLFADLKSSMELLADRDPEEARQLLHPVLGRMMEAVHHYEGTVNQVMGDGIMALFGAPLAHEDHAVRACYAALRMQEGVTRYGDEIQRTYGIPVQIRVGINSGEVVVRSIDSGLHMDYLAVGQTTHLAARMEQMAKPGSVLVTAVTLQQAESHVQARPLGRIPVRGMDAPVEVFELTGAQPVRSRLQAMQARRGLSPFVGRDAEVAELKHVVAQAASGHGQLVAVVGEPGVGKTRLISEFLRSPGLKDWRIIETSAVSYLTPTPYRPVIDLLRVYFALEETDTPATIREKVVARTVELGEPLKEAVAPLCWLTDALAADDAFHALEPRERRTRTLEALKRLLLAESRRQPVLVVIESLQWIDSETHAVLDTLVDALPSTRLVLLVSYRPDFQHGWGNRTYYTQLPIDPLAPASASALLGGLLGADTRLAPLKQLLIERTDGNPFFLEESVRRLVETQVLVGSAGYRLAKPLQAVDVPATVQAVLAARIDRLAAEDKRLLQAASVIGKDVPFTLLQAVADLEPEDLRRRVAHLQAGEFLYETSLFPEVEYTFKHALTHEVAYGSLLRERRRALHARIVEAMESIYASRVGEHIERLAHHAFHGELWEKAVEYFRQAGTRAADRSANQEAAASFEQALAAVKHLPRGRATAEREIDLRLELRPFLLQLGRLQEVLDLSHEAEQLARELGDEPRLAGVYTYLINYHYLKGEPDHALEYGQRCVEIGTARGDLGLQALARRYMGHCYHAQGRYRMAETILAQNLTALDAPPAAELVAHDTVAYVGSAAWLAFALAELGDFDGAQGCVTRGQKVADAARHAYSQAIAWTLAGLVWMRRGQLEAALQPLERSLEACREKHLRVWHPIPASVLGLALARLGRLDEGLPLLEDGVRLSEELGVRAYLALWTAQLGEGLLLAGHAERAHVVAERALDLARAHGEAGHEAWAHWLLGEVAAARPEGPAFADAEREYGAARARAEELGLRPLVGRVELGLGRLYRRTGAAAEAEEHLGRATKLFCALDMRFWVEEACRELGGLGHLVVVAQDQRGLYDYLAQVSAKSEQLLVVLDRRKQERRQTVAAADAPERRIFDRRGATRADDLAARGFVIVKGSSDVEAPVASEPDEPK